jgi:hypothetical protein
VNVVSESLGIELTPCVHELLASSFSCSATWTTHRRVAALVFSA